MTCKECIYENILAQKAEISRLKRQYEVQQEQKAREAQDTKSVAEKRKKDEFLRTQDSVVVGSKRGQSTSEEEDGMSKKRVRVGGSDSGQEDKAKKAELSSFWIVINCNYA